MSKNPMIMRRIQYICLCMALVSVSCISEDRIAAGHDVDRDVTSGVTKTSIIDIPCSKPDEHGDSFPDFSRVGYHYGDDKIPHYPVVRILEPPADGSDATSMIQEAIDLHQGRGAILLKEGIYKVSSQIYLNKSGLVLRGEGGDKTILYSTRTDEAFLEQHHSANILRLGPDIVTGSFVEGTRTRIIGNTETSLNGKPGYTPCGAMYVTVEDASGYAPGDRICVVRQGTKAWIHDIKMDQISNPRGTTVQWDTYLDEDPDSQNINAERVITNIEGNKIWLDNPICMAIEDESYRGNDYGGGYVVKVDVTGRVRESGIENIGFDTVFDPTMKDVYHGHEIYIDEQHIHTAVGLNDVEHCWVDGVYAWHMFYSCVKIAARVKNVTVQNCRSYEPASTITGSRRYAYVIVNSSTCNLIQDCWCELDRHSFTSNALNSGPNVWLRCKSEKGLSHIHPHSHWSVGFLYDNLVADTILEVHDADERGNGQGWRGANFVLWNCETPEIVCQMPWASAKNWAIGCTGMKYITPWFAAYAQNPDDHTPRPDGIWYPECADNTYATEHVAPLSLYDAQLHNRRIRGINVMNASGEAIWEIN